MGFLDRKFKLIGYTSPQKETRAIFRAMILLMTGAAFYILSYYV